MDSKHEIYRLLKKHKAELIRQNKHKIYRLPNGRIFITSATRTNERGYRDQLSTLRKLLQLNPRQKTL